jgi:hypothetical protein
MSDLNEEIKAAIDSFDTDKARELLREAIPEANAETYYLASKVALDDEQKQEFLEKALELDAFHEKARKALRGDKKEESAIVEAETKDVVEPEKAKDDIILPVANVLESGIVYTIPHSRGTERTTLKKGKEVQVVARTSNGNWINVTYINTVKQRAFGWMPGYDLSEITYVGNPASEMDLAISELDFNTRGEVEELSGKDKFAKIAIGIGIFYIIMLLLGLASGTSADGFDGKAFFVIGLMTLPFMGIIYWGVRRHSQPSHGFNGQQMSNARKSKMSTSEIAMEHQQNMLLTTIAGNMATRLVPNKSEVTTRWR